jgi:sodium/hydrogen antiporter
VVYWLVFFSIIVHGLSIPVLSLIYRLYDLTPIREDPVEIRREFPYADVPANSVPLDRHTYLAYNRFSRPTKPGGDLPARQEIAPALLAHRDLLAGKNALHKQESSSSLCLSMSADGVRPP